MNGLLPNEHPCTTCGGQKRVTVYGLGGGPGARTVQSEPTATEVVCEDCDGTGVQATENRDNGAMRKLIDEIDGIWREVLIEHLRKAENHTLLRKSQIDGQASLIKILEAEVRMLRRELEERKQRKSA